MKKRNNYNLVVYRKNKPVIKEYDLERYEIFMWQRMIDQMNLKVTKKHRLVGLLTVLDKQTGRKKGYWYLSSYR
jgi:hypothetical protein